MVPGSFTNNQKPTTNNHRYSHSIVAGGFEEMS